MRTGRRKENWKERVMTDMMYDYEEEENMKTAIGG